MAGIGECTNVGVANLSGIPHANSTPKKNQRMIYPSFFVLMSQSYHQEPDISHGNHL